MPARISSRRPFFLGANLPWLRYGDFGANRWQPGGGLQDASARNLLDESFAQLADEGLDVVRVFLLCDGRAGIEFDDGGVPTRLDQWVYRDLDVLLESARQRGIGLVPVLFDYLWAARPRQAAGVRLGGRSGVLRDPGQRAALLDRVVIQIVDHAGDHPSVLAWDVMNEPEWVTLGLGTWNPRYAVEQVDMHAFLADVAGCVRDRSDREVTVGSASARWLWFVADLDLDFLSPHWYDRPRRDVALTTPVSSFAQGRPVLLGEFPTRLPGGSSGIVTGARQAGYIGALGWSLLSTDRFADGTALVAQAREIRDSRSVGL